MTDAWDGRPQNPERDGMHYITDGVALWIAHKGKWALMSRTRHEPPEWLAAQPWAEYRGPCLLPSEVAAQVEAARQEEREAIARDLDCGCDVRAIVLAKFASAGEREAWRYCEHYDACLALQAAAIRAGSDG